MPTKDRRVSAQKANSTTWKLLKGSLRQRLSAALLAPYQPSAIMQFSSSKQQVDRSRYTIIMSPTAPDSKKPKLDVAAIVWEHYRNFIDSQESDENEDGDVDELVELLELLEPLEYNKPTNDLKSIDSLLPVLCSVAHCHLASNAIYQSVDTTCTPHHEKQQHHHDTVAFHFQKSLAYFPQNAATWSVGANYARMTRRACPQQVCVWYVKAAECASTLRTTALALLESDNVEDIVKEWIELLLLDGIVDCEYVGNDDEEEENGNEDSQATNNHEDDSGYFSASHVEGTSRFMAAMLLSMLGKHDQAKQQLEPFHLTHRLHPNVWTSTPPTATTTTPASEISLHQPYSFTQEALPKPLYNRLCKVLAPDASYWKESDYAHRGYYSYFFNIEKDQPPANLVEEIILHHLLPRAQHVLTNVGNDCTIVGAEWWAHTRPIQANLGHQLHFDTDEALLAQEEKITHPILSSVLYLTGNPNPSANLVGATIVLDQTPDSTRVAEIAWKSVAVDNHFMVFPGDRLHGVLPCPGEEKGNNDTVTTETETFTWNERVTKDEDKPVNHRLTFMVGFWTRRVPDKIKERRLYGPCGPLPPATEEHSWVKEIQQGYPKATNDKNGILDACKLEVTSLPKVSPAWEVIATDEGTDTGENCTDLPLELPGEGIDHRFFVRGAPGFFRESLFHKD
jgi:hypothetical protein